MWGEATWDRAVGCITSTRFFQQTDMQGISLCSPGQPLTQRLHTAFPAARWPPHSSGELSCLLQLSRNQCEYYRLPRRRDVLSHRTHQLHKYGHSAEPLQPLERERRWHSYTHEWHCQHHAWGSLLQAWTRSVPLSSEDVFLHLPQKSCHNPVPSVVVVSNTIHEKL